MLRRCNSVTAIILLLIRLLLLAVATSLRDDQRSMQSEYIDHGTTSRTRRLIINGDSAPETRYPYTASLQLYQKHYCGGALVAPDMVITAAHCAENTPIITLGRYDLDDPLDYDYEEMNVKSKIVHPQFDKVVVDNDVALLILQKQSVHPIIRINNDPNIPIDGEELTVMGWGDIDDHPTIKETSDELREANVWYLTNSKCEQSKGIIKTSTGYQEASYNNELTDNMLCAKDNQGTVSDACQGDSGGCLVRTGSHPTGEDDTLLGLVSWGYGCADPNFPGVYSRMSSIFPWLRETICGKSKAPPEYLSCNTINVPIAVAPSATPPPSSLSGMLTFYIKTDSSPEDTGWELRTVPDNKIVASRPMGYYSQQQTEIFEKEIVEPERFYRLVIYDRDQDGFTGSMKVYKGQNTYETDLLVHEPGFSSKSKGSVTHGFYVGDNPPNVLTLDVKLDGNPTQFAWIITNKEDNLQLGFRWFGFYKTAFESRRETIPIYGGERGLQEYELLIYDNNGDGLCCSSGSGSYALYLGETLSAKNQIISGAKYERDEKYVFQINASGALVSLSSLGTLAFGPAPAPTPTLTTNPAPKDNGYGGYDDASFPTGNVGNTGNFGSSDTMTSDTVDSSSAMSPNGSMLVGPGRTGFSLCLQLTTFAMILLFK